MSSLVKALIQKYAKIKLNQKVPKYAAYLSVQKLWLGCGILWDYIVSSVVSKYTKLNNLKKYFTFFAPGLPQYEARLLDNWQTAEQTIWSVSEPGKRFALI